MEEYDAILEGWVVDGYGRGVVWGEIYGDKKGRFDDGSWIHTSSINEPADLIELKEGQVVKTLNSKYLLGKPLRAYAESV